MRVARHGVNWHGRPGAFASAKHGFLAKRVEIRVVTPGQRDVRHVCKAKPGEYINELGIKDILDQEASRLAMIEGFDFHLVELALNRFNFVGHEKVSTSLNKLDEILREVNQEVMA